MKKIAAILSVSIVLLQACMFDGGHRIKGNGKIVTEIRQFGDIGGIDLSAPVDVYLSEGASNVKIEAEENIIPYIGMHVENGVLHIDTKDNVWFKTRHDVKVYVTAPRFNKVFNSGSGDITGVTKISNDEKLSIDATGSGDMKMEVDAPEINASLTGSGNLTLAGETKKLTAEVTGSGDIEAIDLKSEEAKVQVTGSGDINVYSSIKLEANITGSGDVRYKGEAKVSSTKSGSGDVQKVD